MIRRESEGGEEEKRKGGGGGREHSIINFSPKTEGESLESEKEEGGGGGKKSRIFLSFCGKGEKSDNQKKKRKRGEATEIVLPIPAPGARFGRSPNRRGRKDPTVAGREGLLKRREKERKKEPYPSST